MSIEGLRKRRFSAENFTLLEAVSAEEGLKAREFTYRSDGLLNYGLIEEPDEPAPPEGWPVIVLAHGHIPPDAYSTEKHYRLVAQRFARGGFVVVKPDYRGHGRSEGQGGGPTRTIDYTIDVLNLIAGLNNIPNINPENIFLYGHSMGGEIGLRILTVNQSLRAATLWAAVTQPYPENTLYFIRRRDAKAAASLLAQVEAMFTPKEYALLSPITYLESIKVPLFVHHGTSDESVPFEWSISFRDRLDKAGVNYTFHEYPGEDHNISQSFNTVIDTDIAFFKSLMD